jgi:hypothetical protein
MLDNEYETLEQDKYDDNYTSSEDIIYVLANLPDSQLKVIFKWIGFGLMVGIEEEVRLAISYSHPFTRLVSFAVH